MVSRMAGAWNGLLRIGSSYTHQLIVWIKPLAHIPYCWQDIWTYFFSTGQWPSCQRLWWDRSDSLHALEPLFAHCSGNGWYDLRAYEKLLECEVLSVSLKTYHWSQGSYIFRILHQSWPDSLKFRSIIGAHEQNVSCNLPPMLQVRIHIFEHEVLEDAGDRSTQHVLHMSLLICKVNLAWCTINNPAAQRPILLACSHNFRIWGSHKRITRVFSTIPPSRFLSTMKLAVSTVWKETKKHELPSCSRFSRRLLRTPSVKVFCNLP